MSSLFITYDLDDLPSATLVRIHSAWGQGSCVKGRGYTAPGVKGHALRGEDTRGLGSRVMR